MKRITVVAMMPDGDVRVNTHADQESLLLSLRSLYSICALWITVTYCGNVHIRHFKVQMHRWNWYHREVIEWLNDPANQA